MFHAPNRVVWASEVSIWDEAARGRILVVDDDEALLRMIRLVLLSEGYAVTTATDGVEGLQRLAEHEYDLVVLDLQMPRMDGRAMHAEMRQRGVKTPVLIVSAFEPEAAKHELRAVGAVAKPFDTAVLLEQVRIALK